MRRRSRTLVSASIFPLALMLGAAAPHPEATLKSTVRTVRAGQTLPLQGEKFSADQVVKLALQGALAEYELRDVTANGDGTFSFDLAVPRDVRPGLYRLVAIADDGDVVARLDVTVEPAAPNDAAAPADAGMTGMAGMDHASGPAARADEMPIERSRSGLEWGFIGLLVGLAGGLGIGMFRKPA